MSTELTQNEVRILGCLVEKQITTPEYYPLTLNSLTAACNQKSNRDPVLSLSETEVQAAIDRLRDENLVYLFYGSGSRTVKYKHMLPSVFELDAHETAVLTVLMLRGPQTVGEIKGNSGRLFDFADLGEVQRTLDGLANREEALVVQLERQPGQKEARFAHLLSGTPSVAAFSASVREPAHERPSQADRLGALEAEVARLSNELNTFRNEFNEFRKQFD